MKRNGILKDTFNNKIVQFKSGDFILCGANGELTVKERKDVEQCLDKDTTTNKAICDDYIVDNDRYQVEIFGNKPITLTSNMIKSWAVLKHK
jgi:hypothetical protein